MDIRSQENGTGLLESRLAQNKEKPAQAAKLSQACESLRQQPEQAKENVDGKA
jgi:hypothetical protein